MPSHILLPSWVVILGAVSTNMGEVENGPGQGQIQTRMEATLQAQPAELSPPQGIGQGQCGVNSQRCQVEKEKGVSHWLEEWVKRPTRGQETPFLSLPSLPLLILWALAQTSFLKVAPRPGSSPLLSILLSP